MQIKDFTMADESGPVLIVDDNETDVFLTRRCYEKSNLRNEFIWLSSGADVLDYLGKVERSEAPMPALVLLDVNMPGMDGFETLKKIRARKLFSDVPIMFMFTNSNDPTDEQRAREYGADGFLTKPDDIRSMISFFDSLAA